MVNLCLVIYVSNPMKARRKLKPLVRKKPNDEKPSYIERLEEEEHLEYMKIKVELGQVSIKQENCNRA